MTPQVSNLFRANEWLISKVAPIMGIVYLVVLFYGTGFSAPPLMLFMAMLTALGFAAFGYFLNDLFDIESDTKAGKPNAAAKLAAPFRFIVLFLLLLLALLPWFFLPHNSLSLILIAIQLAAFVLYAVPPFRFKNNPVLSVLADALYAHCVPLVLAFHTFGLLSEKPVPVVLLVGLAAWQFMSGIRYFFNHLALDRELDFANGLKTLATLKGNKWLHKLTANFILPFEILFFLFFLLCLPDPLQLSFFISNVLILIFIYVLIPLILGLPLDIFTAYNFKKIPLDFFYQQLFPLLVLIFLSIRSPWFLLLLFFHQLVFNKPPVFILKFLRRMLSLAVNYGIYYFRKFVLFYTEEKARGEHYAHYLIQQERMKTAGKGIALVNFNKDKYTETFVKGHVQGLSGAVFHYYGTGFPQFEAVDGSLLSTNALQVAWRNLWCKILKLPDDFFQQKAFIADIKRKRIGVILAEFGTVAAKIVGVSRETGIPLVCIFYGYDAYHRQVLAENEIAYKDLFKTAKKIIAVSKPMFSQLLAIGAPEHKLVYLPCYVNLEGFPYTDHSRNSLQFLAVGRFAETKSPHLTILAFHKVWKKYPEARLVMVGKDGGGELFEACHILVKALGMEKCVDFKGVMTSREVFAEMQKAYAFVQHSVTTPIHADSEGTPVAIMEAMACGLPVIATKHAGIMDMVVHGDSGLLVDEYDIDSMAGNMLLLIENSDKARAIGLAAAQHIRSNELVVHHMESLSHLLTDAMN